MKTFTLAACLFLIACTNQQVYESIQANQKNRCAKEPSLSLQKKCEETLMPYEEYEQRRSEK